LSNFFRDEELCRYPVRKKKKTFSHIEKILCIFVPIALSALQSRAGYALNERKQKLIVMRKAPYITNRNSFKQARSADKGVRLL
jgi:hypothetical protein